MNKSGNRIGEWLHEALATARHSSEVLGSKYHDALVLGPSINKPKDLDTRILQMSTSTDPYQMATSVYAAGVPSYMQRMGVGTKMYGAEIRRAFEEYKKGGPSLFTSDPGGNTSNAANGVWDKLGKKGYPVQGPVGGAARGIDLSQMKGFYKDKSASVQDLKKAKEHSDKRQYSSKHLILQNLLRKSPEDFIVDSRDGNIVGLTHSPSGFRIHVPVNKLPAGFSPTAKSVVDNAQGMDNNIKNMTKASFIKLAFAMPSMTGGFDPAKQDVPSDSGQRIAGALGEAGSSAMSGIKSIGRGMLESMQAPSGPGPSLLGGSPGAMYGQTLRTSEPELPTPKSPTPKIVAQAPSVKPVRNARPIPRQAPPRAIPVAQPVQRTGGQGIGLKGKGLGRHSTPGVTPATAPTPMQASLRHGRGFGKGASVNALNVSTFIKLASTVLENKPVENTWAGIPNFADKDKWSVGDVQRQTPGEIGSGLGGLAGEIAGGIGGWKLGDKLSGTDLKFSDRGQSLVHLMERYSNPKETSHFTEQLKALTRKAALRGIGKLLLPIAGGVAVGGLLGAKGGYHAGMALGGSENKDISKAAGVGSALIRAGEQLGHVIKKPGLAAGLKNHFKTNAGAYARGAGTAALGYGVGHHGGYNKGYTGGQQAGYDFGQDVGKQVGYSLAQNQTQNTGILGRLTGNYNFDPSALQGAGPGSPPAEIFQQQAANDPNKLGLIRSFIG